MGLRYRKIYSLIWDDEVFQTLNLGERMIALYCLTCKNVNRIGLYCFSEWEAMDKLRLSRKTFRRDFERVRAKFEWPYDRTLRVLYIPSWWKWNTPENPNVLKGNLEDIAELPR